MKISFIPCPKCGSERIKLIRGLPNTGNSKTRYALVQCLKCRHKTETLKPAPGEKDSELKERAIALWNGQQ